MNADRTKQAILTRIEELKQQIKDVSDQIERDRREDDEDSSVLQELLDKKDFLEQTIADLLDSIKNNELPDSLGTAFKVNINGTTRVFQIVHASKADAQNGLISADSPIATALGNNRAGDNVEFETPGGKQVLEILEVSYA